MKRKKDPEPDNKKDDKKNKHTMPKFTAELSFSGHGHAYISHTAGPHSYRGGRAIGYT